MTAAASIASVAGLVGALYYLDVPALLSNRAKSCQIRSRCYHQADQPPLAALRALTDQATLKTTYQLAYRIEKNVPIYDAKYINHQDEQQIEALQDEWHHALLYGPGVFVLKNFFTDLGIIDEANSAYDSIIAGEQAESGAKGDHFAAASTNTRIWNSFSKHCLQDPSYFIKYYSNPLFKLVSEAWLGPAYRITAQVNIVHPGGQAQTSHRDYHLGFQTAEDTAKWPKSMHVASQHLTLQGAIAHTDMPLECGPTRLLPFSQMFEAGFMAYRRPEFIEYFMENYIALPLEKGAAIFFNPALFHAAGENRTSDFHRSANLIQVSSAFGKTMESIDSIPIVEKCWDELSKSYQRNGMGLETDAFVRAIGEGYPFPTNLDRRPPAPGGMAPESEQDVLRKGLRDRWNRERVVDELIKMKRASAA